MALADVADQEAPPSSPVGGSGVRRSLGSDWRILQITDESAVTDLEERAASQRIELQRQRRTSGGRREIARRIIAEDGADATRLAPGTDRTARRSLADDASGLGPGVAFPNNRRSNYRRQSNRHESWWRLKRNCWTTITGASRLGLTARPKAMTSWFRSTRRSWKIVHATWNASAMRRCCGHAGGGRANGAVGAGLLQRTVLVGAWRPSCRGRRRGGYAWQSDRLGRRG